VREGHLKCPYKYGSALNFGVPLKNSVTIPQHYHLNISTLSFETRFIITSICCIVEGITKVQGSIIWTKKEMKMMRVCGSEWLSGPGSRSRVRILAVYNHIISSCSPVQLDWIKAEWCVNFLRFVHLKDRLGSLKESRGSNSGQSRNHWASMVRTQWVNTEEEEVATDKLS
jgi:hypothetical protein